MIIAIIILLFASFFFSGSETALTAANRMKIQTEAENGDKNPLNYQNYLQNPVSLLLQF